MDKLQSARLIALPNLKVDSDTSIVATVLRRHRITMQIVARVETVHAALALVLAGEGYAIVPACAAVGGPQGVVFRKLAGVSEGFDVAVSRRRDAKSPFIEPFISVAGSAVR